jgi:hypothetical protein
LPTDTEPKDEAIEKLRTLCVRNKLILNSLKNGRDGLFTAGKISTVLGLLMLIIRPSIGLELILFSLCVAGVIHYLDRYMINNGAERDHILPTREDIFVTKRYNLLLKRYTTLEKLCDAWFLLSDEIRDKCDSVALINKDDKETDNRLCFEMRSD